MTRRLTVWAPTPRAAFVARGSRATLPFPLDQPECRIFSRARHALWTGVRALGLRSGDEVLVPAYHHGSEIEALVRAGLVLRFYEVGPDLRPDPDHLDQLRSDRARALLLIHYLGLPQDAPAWRAWCGERGLLLLEDAAQSWLAETDQVPLGSSGHLAIFCLYKQVGLPDGAALICSPPPDAPTPPRGAAQRVTRNFVANEMLRSTRLVRILERREVGQWAAGLLDFELGDPTAGVSPATTYLLPRVIRPDVASQRRENYRALLEELGEHVPPAFREPPPGASPMAFPVSTEGRDKGALLRALTEDGIDGLDFWSVPHPTLPVASFPDSAARRRTVVGLPVHHLLTSVDLTRISGAVRRGMQR